jgi:hypothetical protein
MPGFSSKVCIHLLICLDICLFMYAVLSDGFEADFNIRLSNDGKFIKIGEKSKCGMRQLANW